MSRSVGARAESAYGVDITQRTFDNGIVNLRSLHPVRHLAHVHPNPNGVEHNSRTRTLKMARCLTVSTLYQLDFTVYFIGFSIFRIGLGWFWFDSVLNFRPPDNLSVHCLHTYIFVGLMISVVPHGFHTDG